MKCMIVVLAVASFCLAEPEADPLHYYAPYGYAYPYVYRPYGVSGYAGPLQGGYQSVHRVHLHKREAEAEADPQLLLAAGAAPYVNDGPVAGPLTPAFGDAVQTPRGLASIALEGFSEDVNQDGFVDPIAPAVPVVAAPVAPLVHAAPLVQAAPVAVAAATPVVKTVEAPAPVVQAAPAVLPFNTFPAPAALPLNAIPAPVFNPAFAVPHAPVVKTVVETPAAVETEVVASPLFHHIPAPLASP